MKKANACGNKKQKVFSSIIEIICILALSFIEFLILQLSCSIKEWKISFPLILLNVSILMIINGVFLSALPSPRTVFFLSYFTISVISIVNYYTIELHGNPLNIDEIKNALTAFNALSGYSLRIYKFPALIIILLCFSSLAFVLFKKKVNQKSEHFSYARSVLVILSLSFVVFSYCSPLKIRPQYVINWSWRWSYGSFGYVTCCLEDIYSRGKIISKPKGYDKFDTYKFVNVLGEKSNNDSNALSKKDKSLPDIILILNETFYDLNKSSDLSLDADPFQYSKTTNELYKGYAVVPTIGGGTNRSEYELLTSNSLSLMRSSITPFNQLDFCDANTVISHLKKLGYQTIGVHPCSSINYNRKKVYSDIGFDHIHFSEDFVDFERYRQYISDKSLYEYVINWYEELKGDSPVFAYILTIQNHGDYSGINPDPELIHNKEKIFDDDDATNEFITSISKSDEAFFELTQYFKDSDRPVIIAMVGDHCPAFAKELLDGEHDEALNILLRETPAYIWANYDLGIEDHDLGEMGLISFVPTLLDMAGVPSNAYYDYILEMKKSIPILTVEGDAYADAYHKLSNDNDLLKNYQYLEYLNLKEPDWEK